MRCYYDVLGVQRNADNAELKKAYYKMSLQWHPDKNASAEDTTVIFQQIQEAYRVLSDPQERAWYDSHRAQILQSGGQKAQMGSTAEYEEDRVDVFQFFSRSCFEGFDDGKKGFYTVYRKVFDDIADEELRARDFDAQSSSSTDEGEEKSANRGRNGNSSREYPTFGQAASPYADVVASFYQFWEAFRTHKNYSWVEKYDIRCAESRPERRAMEQENRRLRNAARRKRNEEIRQLVAYVKKRDKRVAAERERVQQLNQQAQARTQQMAREARQREATRLAEAWNEELAYGGLTSQWAEEFEAELAKMEAELDGLHVGIANETRNNEAAAAAAAATTTEVGSSDNLSEVDELYCVACDKLFASVKAKLNHEASKKHKKQAEILRKILLEEERTAMKAGESEKKSDDDCSSMDNDHLDDRNFEQPDSPRVNEVKLTKRAKKAQRKRRKEEEKLNVTSDNPIPDNTAVPDNDPAGDVGCQTPESNAKKEDKPKSTPVQAVQESVAKSLCKTCNTEFQSRNQLFAHLKESGHAQLKPVTVQSNSKKGKKKGR